MLLDCKVRGRPSAPLWTPELQLYICEHRYKDDDYTFKKIKNWDSCAPSNVRTEGHDENFVPFPSAQSSTSMVRVDSPFLVPSTEAIQASGEPIITSPAELAKSLPKDQVKYHKELSLEQIQSILGVMPSAPPRLPHVTRSPDTSARHTPRLRPSTPAGTTTASSTPVMIAAVPKPNPVPPPSQPLVGTQPVTVLPQSAHVPPSTPPHRPPNPLDLPASQLSELLKQIEPSRKTPCLLDVYAHQETFQKLPDELLSAFTSGPQHYVPQA